MAEYCENCSAEVFPGQRFCRSCGKPTPVDEHLPTQRMGQDPGGSRRQANTAPPVRPDTSPVYTPPPYYQSQTYQPPHLQQTMPPYAQPRSRSPWGWIIALVSVGFFAAIVLAIFIITSNDRRPERRTSPPAAQAAAASSKAIADSFPLSANATVTLRNVGGNVTVEGWDEPRADVKITMRGGTAAERDALKVIIDKKPDSLSIQLPQGRNNNINVDYEIKLPRKLAKLEVSGASTGINIRDVEAAVTANTQSGSIDLTDITGDVSVSTASGSIELSDVSGKISANTASGSIELNSVSGAVRSNTASGSIEAVFDRMDKATGLEFNTASGSIELQFQDELNVELDADTTSGDIELDDSFGITTEKKTVGQRASGQIGQGGPPLKIRTVSGDIRVAGPR